MQGPRGKEESEEEAKGGWFSEDLARSTERAEPPWGDHGSLASLATVSRSGGHQGLRCYP